jgi:deoxycytidylate deaminase
MKLTKFYSLRNDFTIIGLTGRLGSGCTQIARHLCNPVFMQDVAKTAITENSSLEDLKHNICYDFLNHPGNWIEFQVINYKNILMLHFLFESLKNVNIDTGITQIVAFLCQNGFTVNPELELINRFDKTEDTFFLNDLLIPFLETEKNFLQEFQSTFDYEKTLNENFEEKKTAYALYFGNKFLPFCERFYKTLNNHNMIKRTRFTHDIAQNLRARGTIETGDIAMGLEHINTIAETINRIIKSWRSESAAPTRFVIDSLKNSLEIMYFKEKFSAFYMIASNKSEEDRILSIAAADDEHGSKSEDGKQKLKALDDAEFKTNDFKAGRFFSPDIENCIQKCDYHIFIESEKSEKNYTPFKYQIIRLISLIKKPGIVTPSTNEHFMQVAYNAKSNSGCISRQVGAVVTDENYSIKAIGWNDVPENQVPCGLRDIRDLINHRNEFMFSDFEKSGGNYDDNVLFNHKADEELKKSDTTSLDGRVCTYCFRDFHNAFEGEKNQIHTRSLHAEENAMMQITKFGGGGIKGGKLYTTASPCELCSKKAYQLGISEIFYIDPYPGIATTHTLKSGMKDIQDPELIMFQGAVGRAYNKLYEPFISQKDEIAILTGLKPIAKIEDKLKTLTKDKKLKDKISTKFKDKSSKDQEALLDKYLNMLIDKD